VSVDPSALSVAARELRDYLAPKLGLTVDQVSIGHPSAAAREQDTNSSNPRDLLNLFFYRVEHDGYPADGAAEDPFYVRAYCLLTAFCLNDTENNGFSAGEKDLRLIGGAMHWLHAQPFVHVRGADDTEVAVLQVVMSPLSVDDINHIWATQGELPYRLSVCYELALMPVPIAKPTARQPRVGALGLQVGPATALDPGMKLGFRVPPVRVATADPGWVPAIRFVDADSIPCYTLAFPTALAPTEVEVVGAGVPGASVDLVWEQWSSASGWQPLVATQSLSLHTDHLDPDTPIGVPKTSVALPDRAKGQLQLTAQRMWQRADGATVALRSNPLLISLYEEPAP